MGTRCSPSPQGRHGDLGANHALLDHMDLAKLMVFHHLPDGVGLVHMEATSTPLPRARPSALTTMGAPCSSM